MLQCTISYMTQDILTELLKLRLQLDTIIAKVQVGHPPGWKTVFHHAAATLPNPAPAAALAAAVTQQLGHPVSAKQLSPLLQAHGYGLQRRSTGNFYWRPNLTAPSSHERHDPEQQQDQ